MSRKAMLESLPGGDWMAAGLDDYEAGRLTMAALLVAMAAGRLERAGLVRCRLDAWLEPEFAFYELLRGQGGDAYARYNSWRRELDSFLAALSRRNQPLAPPGGRAR